MNDCEELILPALEKALIDFQIQSAPNGCEVITPFQRPDGDLISIWVEHRAGSMYDIRDYGETFAYLNLSGVDPTTKSRQQWIGYINKQYQLESSSGEIIVKAEKDDLGPRLFDIIQAIMSISRLTYTHKAGSPTRFKSQVESYLSESGYSFEENFSIQGLSLERNFDFAINHRSPSVLLDTIHTSSEDYLDQKADTILVNWYVIRDLEYRHGAIVDDVDGIYEESKLQGLIQNLDYVFRWTDKGDILDEIPVTA